MMNHNTCVETFEYCEAKYRLTVQAGECVVREVMLESLCAQMKNLPPSSASALSVAKMFQTGKATVAELSAARVQMWELIEGIDCNFGDSFVCTIRAVICVLFPIDKNDDSVDSMTNFLEFYQGAKLDEAIAKKTMEEVYAKYAS